MMDLYIMFSIGIGVCMLIYAGLDEWKINIGQLEKQGNWGSPFRDWTFWAIVVAVSIPFVNIFALVFVLYPLRTQ